MGFRSKMSGIGLVTLTTTKLRHLFIFWGPFLMLGFSWLAYEVYGWAAATRAMGSAMVEAGNDLGGKALPPISNPASFAIVGLMAPISGLIGFWGRQTLGLLLFFGVVAMLVVWRALQAKPAPAGGPGRKENASRDELFVLLLLLGGLALITICEMFFIRDFFGNRMNTVFKLYYQAWMLLSVASAFVVYYLASLAARVSLVGRAVGGTWLAVASVVVVAALVYPFAAVNSKANGFKSGPEFDGMAYLAKSGPDDYSAIQWLKQNVAGTPVIVEVSGGSYSQNARVSAHTGLPTLLGWDFHERQWRGKGIDAVINERKMDLDTIYGGTDLAAAQTALKKYGVTYVYVGPQERQQYAKQGTAGLDKLARVGEVAYRNSGVIIYKVRD